MSVVSAALPEKISGRLQRLGEWADGRLNPVLLKDLRCWLRSPAFLAVFFIGLALTQLVTVTLILASEGHQTAGGDLAQALLSGLGFFLGGIIPYLMQSRFAEELRNRSTELALISRLTPGQLLRGKIFSSLAATLLYFSACGPSLLLAYLLGGIGLDVLLYGLVVVAFLSATSCVLGLVLVAVSHKKPLRLLGLASFAAGVFIAWLVYRMVRNCSWDTTLSEPFFQAANLAVLAIILAALHFLYAAAVSRLAFQAEDRDWRPRLALTILTLVAYFSIFLLPAIAIVVGENSSGLEWPTSTALLMALIAFLIGCLFLLDTPEQLSLRVRSQWLDWRPPRLLYAPGPGRLYAYILTHFALFLFAAFLCGPGPHLFQSYTAELESYCAIVFVLYGFFYLALPVWGDRLLRHFFPRVFRNLGHGLLVGILLTAWCVVGITLAAANSLYGGPDRLALLTPISAAGYFLSRPSIRIDDLLFCGLVIFPPVAVILFFWIPQIVRAFKENREIAAQQRALLAAAPPPAPEPEAP